MAAEGDQFFALAAKLDPSLANPSAYVRALAAFLNDRQPDAEKSTPETEWRRMRDIWGAINLIGRTLIAAIRELEESKQLSISVEQKVGSGVADPSEFPYDPLNDHDYGGGGGNSSGGISVAQALWLIRRGVSDAMAAALVPGDHGLLTGLADDDHPQYLLVSGSRAMTGPLSMGTNLIGSVVNPVSAQDAATKNYVDTQIALSALSTQDTNRRFVYAVAANV